MTIDLGRPENLHPPRKREVAERLARWAEREVYGREVAWRGPRLSSYEIRGGEVVLRFADDGGGLATAGGGTLRGFVMVTSFPAT